MLVEVARKLDAWIVDQNLLLSEEGLLRHSACTIRVLGQSALIEADLGLRLLTTKDVDVRADYDDGVRREFARLLAQEGRELDPLGHEVWMPRETRYAELFRGKFVRLLLAEPEAVLVSKALKAPSKNAPLIAQYLATFATERFFQLARKYRLDLEQFT
jgi:hypothetical protein